MSQYTWQAQSFLGKTTSKPLAYCIYLLIAVITLGTGFSAFYEVEKRIFVDGEIVSRSGEKEVIASRDGVAILKDISIGAEVSQGQILGTLEIPYTTHQEVSELLRNLKQLHESLGTMPTGQRLEWSSRPSENNLITENLEKFKIAVENYNNEIQTKKQLAQLKLGNLSVNRTKLEKRMKVLQIANYKELTEGLVDEQKREISSLEEEKVKIQNDSEIKLSSARNQLLSTLTSSYLTIYEYYDSFLIKAYSSGKISKFLISASQQVKKNQGLLVVAPIADDYEIKLAIPTYEVGKLKPNLGVNASVDSYPYQKFGHFVGQILRIDQSVTLNSSGSAFIAYATIEKPVVKTASLRDSIQLLPGMKVKAQIVLKKMTLFSLLYEKLFLNAEI